MNSNFSGEIKNDSMDKQQYREFCKKFIENLKDNFDGIFYCWGAQGKDGRLLFTILDDYLHNSTTVMWYKDQFTLGRGKYKVTPEAVIASVFKFLVYLILIIGLKDIIFV